MSKINNLDCNSAFEWEDLAATTLIIPNGVTCPISAETIKTREIYIKDNLMLITVLEDL
ncbi:MAG: hypothetical protein WCG14_05725 [Chlamydiia bacterium]